MTIGIVVNEEKDVELTVLRRMIDSLEKEGMETVFSTGIDMPARFMCPSDLKSRYADTWAALTECDTLICIGGDGTLIKLAKKMTPSQKPILGINLGTLGYLTEAEISDTDLIAKRIKNHDYRIEERMMLSIRRLRNGQDPVDSKGLQRAEGFEGTEKIGESVQTGESEKTGESEDPGESEEIEETALNEIAISRGNYSHIISLKVSLNDTLLDVYPGDGLIVATPTGSTAYALSAGGAVLEPKMQAISIIPICPHMIFSRQIITGTENVIRISAAAHQKSDISVSIDGVAVQPLRNNETLHISKSKYGTKLICFDPDKFYGMLKSKLYNRGEMLYREEIGTAGNNTRHHQS